ncbi:MAG: TRL-like family protein [Planctomycetota bacterium]|nr:TRL-like family protein [Planctomycetota bacterium]
MISRVLSSALICAVLFTSGCAATNAPASGLLFTSVAGPLNATDFGAPPPTQPTSSYSSTAAAATPAPTASKTGTSETTGFLWLVSIGDASIDAAKKNGAITRVASVDYQHVIVLGGLFSKYTTVVKGE